MVDRSARVELERALRGLADGEMTNDAFEDAMVPLVRRSEDPGVFAVYDAAWRLYDDGREYRVAHRVHHVSYATSAHARQPLGRRDGCLRCQTRRPLGCRQ